MKLVVCDVWRERDQAKFSDLVAQLEARGIDVVDPYVSPTRTSSRDEWIDLVMQGVRRAVADGEPWGLLGFCAGGRVALELSRRFADESRPPSFVGLIETWIRSPLDEIERHRYRRFGIPLGVQLRQQMLWVALERRDRWSTLVRERLRDIRTNAGRQRHDAPDRRPRDSEEWKVMHYTHARMVTVATSHVHLFNSETSIGEFDDNPSLGLAPFLRGGFTVHVVAGGHHTCTQPPHQTDLVGAVLAAMSGDDGSAASHEL